MTTRAMRPVAPLLGCSSVLLAVLLLSACGDAQSRKDRYVEKATALLEAEDYAAAEVELLNALQIEPNDAGARVLLAKTAEQLGDPRRALQMYQSGLELDPGSLAARAGLSKLYLYAGLPDKALEILAPGLEKSPDDADLLTVRAAARYRLGESAAALADVEHALRSQPDNESAIALLASFQVREQRTDAAIELLESGVRARPRSADLRIVLAQVLADSGRQAEAAQQLVEVVKLQPDELQHRYRLARLYVAANDVDKAEATLREAIRTRPDDPEPKLALVDLLASRRSPEAGEKELLALVASRPDDLELRLGLGDFYSARGKAAEAEQAYRAVVDAAGTQAPGLSGRNRLAAAAMRTNRFEEAERLIAEVLEANPQDNDALVMRADLALARGDASSAITDLRSVARDQPDSIPIQRALVRAHLASGDLALAEDTLRKAVTSSPGDRGLRVELAQVIALTGKPDQARRTLEDLVAEDPGYFPAIELLYRYQVGTGDYAAARKTAALARSAQPASPAGDFMLGLVDRAEGKTDAARQSFENSLKLAPGAKEPLTALVELLIGDGRPEQAVAVLQQAAAQQPRNAVIWNLLGETLGTQNRLAESAAAFEKAIGLAPGWWIPYHGLGGMQLAAGQEAAGLATFQRGIDATGRAVPLVTALAAVHLRAGRPEDAIRLYESIGKDDYLPDLAANNLAMLLVTYRSGAADLERAGRLTGRFKDSSNPAHLDTYGWVQYRLDRVPEATLVLERAAELAPDSPAIRYHLGAVQLSAGQRAAAEQNLRKALAANVGFLGIDDARAMLEGLDQQRGAELRK